MRVRIPSGVPNLHLFSPNPSPEILMSVVGREAVSSTIMRVFVYGATAMSLLSSTFFYIITL